MVFDFITSYYYYFENMLPLSPTLQKIRTTIEFIQQKQQQMQCLRQQLNQQIMFNLKDAYTSIANAQKTLNIKTLAKFMHIHPSQEVALEKYVKWNNQNSSLNLTFAEFSATLLSKQDKLLAKMMLQRQQLGAIPNYLLELIRKIINKQLQIHEYCLNCQITNQPELLEWIQSVIDEDHQLNHIALTHLVQSSSSRGSDKEQDEHQQKQNLQMSPLFLRFIASSDNLTQKGLRFLWEDNQRSHVYQKCDQSTKLNKISTIIESPKSNSYSHILTNIQSPTANVQMSVRAQFFDCIHRPLVTQNSQYRIQKSIQKHIGRVNSQYRLQIINKNAAIQSKIQQNIANLMLKLKQIIAVQRSLQKVKIQLCLCPDFFPILFYQSIPKDKNNNILAYGLKNYLQYFGQAASLQGIFLMFKRYQKKHKYMNFNSFCRIFDVSRNQFQLLEKNRLVTSLNDVGSNTKKRFFAVLMQSIHSQEMINRIKMEINSSLNGQLVKSIEYLFQNHQKGMTIQSLKNIFEEYTAVKMPQRDVKLLWNRLILQEGADQLLKKQTIIKQLITSTKNTTK